MKGCHFFKKHFAVQSGFLFCCFLFCFSLSNESGKYFVNLMSVIFDNSKVNKRLYCLQLQVFLCHRKTRFLSYVLVRVCGQWKTLTRGTGTSINSDREHDDQQLTLRGHAGDARHIKAIQTNTDNDCEQGNHQLAFFYVPAGGARAGGVRSSPNFLKYVHVSDAKSTRCLLHACKLWKKCSAVHAVHVHASYARGVHRYTF